MKKFICQSNLLASILVLSLLLTACGPSGGSRTTGTPTAAQSLELLLKQAKAASPAEQSRLYVQIGGLLSQENRFEKAQEILIRVNQPMLTPSEVDDFRLYYGETLLGLSVADASLKQLTSINNLNTKPVEWQVRYAQALSDTYLAVGNYFEAAKLRIELEDLMTDSEQLQKNNEKIWQALGHIEPAFLQSLISDFNTARLNGWLEVVYINERWGHNPGQLIKRLAIWKQRYPLHPSQVNQPETLQRAADAKPFKPRQIAVLLPLTGKNAAVGNMIQNGIVAAHYQQADAEQAPKIFFYDTGLTLSPLTPYEKALEEGADFILGPLTKEAIEAISSQETVSVPMLALNRLDSEESQHELIFQFGLPIEDEAIQVAHRAYDKGYRKAVAFLPDNTIGSRAEATFKEYFENLGGELVEVQTYSEAKGLKEKVQGLLGVDKSQNRKRAIEQLLGRNLEFEMRRRQDADFIFMVASPNMGRRIKPFIDFFYAHDLPVIATSMIYSGEHNPKTDIDLNGIEFPDIPLLLSELPDFKTTREALAQTLPAALDARGRFFALGFDSYRILEQLAILRAFPDYRWNGLAGELGVDENGLVHRFLTWAQFNRGIPFVIEERQVKQVESMTEIPEQIN